MRKISQMLHLRLPSYLYSRLKAFCAARSMSYSDLMTKALVEYLERHKDDAGGTASRGYY